MLRLLKRAVPLAVVLVLGLQGSALATTKDVAIANFSFTPKITKARLGDTVRWTNTTPGTPHTSSHDAKNPMVWDSGVIAPGGGTFSLVFKIAGSFTYHCNIHPFMMGSVQIRPNASPAAGPAGTVFTITAALISGPGNVVYDIQIRAPGGPFVNFVVGNNSGTVKFNSKNHRAGLYQFRARMRNARSGKVSGFSTAVGIMVT